MNSRIVKIVLPIALDKEFDYTLPPNTMAKIGSRVLVDLRGQNQVGIILRFTDTSAFTQLKTTIEVLDAHPLLSYEHIKFAKCLARFYPYPIGEFLFMMLPSYLKKGKKFTFDPIPLPEDPGLRPWVNGGSGRRPTRGVKVLGDHVHARGLQFTLLLA